MSHLGYEIKKLGFGLMRLPQKDGVIDVEQVKVMVDKFMDAGFHMPDVLILRPQPLPQELRKGSCRMGPRIILPVGQPQSGMR